MSVVKAKQSYNKGHEHEARGFLHGVGVLAKRGGTCTGVPAKRGGTCTGVLAKRGEYVHVRVTNGFGSTPDENVAKLFKQLMKLSKAKANLFATRGKTTA